MCVNRLSHFWIFKNNVSSFSCPSFVFPVLKRELGLRKFKYHPAISQGLSSLMVSLILCHLWDGVFRLFSLGPCDGTLTMIGGYLPTLHFPSHDSSAIMPTSALLALWGEMGNSCYAFYDRFECPIVFEVALSRTCHTTHFAFDALPSQPAGWEFLSLIYNSSVLGLP